MRTSGYLRYKSRSTEMCAKPLGLRHVSSPIIAGSASGESSEVRTLGNALSERGGALGIDRPVAQVVKQPHTKR